MAQKDKEPRILNFQEFKSEYLEGTKNQTLILNFWATWCKPCVAELPHFEALNAKLDPKKEKLVLVSLDFTQDVKRKLIPFLNKHKLQADVIVLDPYEVKDWVDQIDPSWSGVIPATLVFCPNSRKFIEKNFETEQELLLFVNCK
ncbi:MAG: TlpA family protein disulfide reductase [Bacteroidota bacterium]|nr:TlpA family protein disulfide reductase [Bacteroidota bacterium]